MAIKRITLEGFKNLQKFSIDLGANANYVLAANGVGKSTIADALSFTYCNTDRFGNVKPLHLINKDMDKMKVVIETDTGAEIFRSLTKSGSPLLKVTKNGVPNKMTQTQLSGLIGPQDVFLSAILPGYFMSLDHKKRKEVFNSILPKIDPYQIVLAETGVDLKDKDLAIDLSKKTAATRITESRREAEKGKAAKEGEINALRSITLPSKPESPTEAYETIEKYKEIKQAWNTYGNALNVYNAKQASYEREVEEIKTHESNRVKWETELKEIGVPAALPDRLDRSAEINKLEAQKLPAPAKPSLQSTVDAESCPTCGQVVSKKLRDTVAAANKAAQTKYDEEVNNVTRHNAEIAEKITQVREQATKEDREFRELEQSNAKITNRINSLKGKLMGEVKAMPEAPTKPLAPEVRSDEEAYSVAVTSVSNYEKAKAIYDDAFAKASKAEERIESLSSDIANIDLMVEKLQKVEATVKNLPNIILEKNKENLAISGIDLLFVDNEVRVKVNEIPYTALSSGQQMRADIALAQKVNSLMKNPVNIMFLDDADLLDELPEIPGQVMYAMVRAGQEQVLVQQELEYDQNDFEDMPAGFTQGGATHAEQPSPTI